MFSRSDMWTTLGDQWGKFDLKTDWRRAGPVARAMCVRDPSTNGLRNHLSLLILALAESPASDRDLYARILHRNIGNPYTVHAVGTDIDMNYFRALHDFKKIMHYGMIENVTVLEIGAGFGALAHTFLSLGTVKKYIIVDIQPVLSTAQTFLSEVLEEAVFQKITFIDAETEFSRFEEDVDLVINVDSLNEMNAYVAQAYMDWMSTHAKVFYCNNPVGKYIWDENVPTESDAAKRRDDALKVGPMRATTHLFDLDSITALLPEWTKAYCPQGWQPAQPAALSRPFVFQANCIFHKPEEK